MLCNISKNNFSPAAELSQHEKMLAVDVARDWDNKKHLDADFLKEKEKHVVTERALSIS